MKKLFILAAHAQASSKTAKTGTKAAEGIIERNMKNAGKTQRQINAAIKRSRKVNGTVTRVGG